MYSYMTFEKVFTLVYHCGAVDASVRDQGSDAKTLHDVDNAMRPKK